MIDDGERKFYTAKLVVEFDYATWVFEDSEDPKTELEYALDEGFQQFLKDKAQGFEPTSIEIVSVVEQEG